MSVVAIILAAGASSRLGRPKQLLHIGTETLLERAHRIALEAGAHPVFSVLGAHAAIIQASLSLHDTVVVHNDRWGQGISSSIHAGLHALQMQAPQAAGALFMSCDQVRVTPDHLVQLIRTFEQQLTPTIVASSYAGIQGVPAVFPCAVFAHLLALTGDKGARSLLVNPPAPVITLPLEGGEVDIDLPSDLRYIK